MSKPDFRNIEDNLAQEPLPFQSELAKCVRNHLQQEIALLSSEPHVFSPHSIELASDVAIPSAILRDKKFNDAFNRLQAWESNPHRELRYEGQSVISANTQFGVITTPSRLRNKSWRDQVFFINGTPLNFSLEERSGLVTVDQQPALSDEVTNSSLHKKDGDGAISRLDAIKKEEQRLLETLLKNGVTFDSLSGKIILSGDRLMTDKEMTVWSKELGAMPVVLKEVDYSNISQRDSSDYGHHLYGSGMNDKGQRMGDPNVIVPLHLNVDGKSAWITADVMFQGRSISAVHLRHGFLYLPRMMRSVKAR